MKLAVAVGRSGLILCASLAAMAPAEAQAPPAPAPTDAAPTTSLILTTITVPMPVVGRAVEAAVPKTGSGTVVNPVKNPVIVDDVLTWNFTRSPLQTKGESGAIVISSTISGTTHMKGTVSLVRGELRRFIGNAGIPDIPFSGTTAIRATSTARARPQLLPTWRVQPNLTLSAKVQRASLPIKGFGTVSIQGQVQSQIDAQVGELRRQLEAKMRDDTRIETEARKGWDALCRAHPLDMDRDGKPELYLRVTPLRARAAQPVIDATGIAQQVGIEAKTEVSHDGARPVCPFPATVELQPMAEPRFDITLPVEIGFTQLNTLVGSQLPRTIENAEYRLRAEIRRITVAPADSGRLALSVDATVSAMQADNPSPTRSTFVVRATPRLDAARQRITFTNAEIDPASLEAFGLTGVLATGAARMLETAIAELEIDVAAEAARLPRLAEAAVATLNGAKDSEVEITATFDPPKLIGLDFDETRLRMIAQARGKVTAAIRTAKVD